MAGEALFAGFRGFCARFMQDLAGKPSGPKSKAIPGKPKTFFLEVPKVHMKRALTFNGRFVVCFEAQPFKFHVM